MKLLALFALILSSPLAIAGAQEVQRSPGIVIEVLKAGSTLKYPSYLVDGHGRALYMWYADTQGGTTSACYDACAKAWPPAIIESEVSVEFTQRADEVQIGEIMRTDGTRQLTFNGWPLYYFYKDTGAGETFGQGLDGFGALWWLMRPDGSIIEEEAAE
jgi:predicted lipoprotein with Yx(FWY)xxD motif